MEYPVTLRGGVAVKDGAELIAVYRPNGVTPADWDQHIGPVVRDLTTKSGFTSRGTVQHTMKGLTRLVVWARTHGVPLAPEVLLHPDTVERFIATGIPNLSERSRATRRSALRAVSIAVTTKTPWTPLPPKMRRSYYARPYSAAELGRWWEVATSQKTPGRDRAARAMVALGLGVGVSASEHLTITGHNVIKRHGVVAVQIGGRRARTVPCVAMWSDRLLQLASEVGDEPLIGSFSSAVNRTYNLMRPIEVPPSMPRLESPRLRTSWMAELLTAGVPIKEFARACGLNVVQHMEDFLPFLPDMDEASAFLRLAGTTK